MISLRQPEEDTLPAGFSRIVCVVCGLPSKQPIGAIAKLCQPCLVDPIITRQYVEGVLAKAEATTELAFSDFQEKCTALPEDLWQRWCKAHQMIQSGKRNDPAFVATWQRAKSAGGVFGELLEAYEHHETVAIAAEEQRKWAYAARDELALL